MKPFNALGGREGHTITPSQPSTPSQRPGVCGVFLIFLILLILLIFVKPYEAQNGEIRKGIHQIFKKTLPSLMLLGIENGAKR